jgi:Gpi18-like mannosyltransferase
MDSHRFAPRPLLALLGAGLLLRLLLAYVLFPNSGHPGDIGLYSQWALTLASVGPGDFYAKTDLVDYPPGYLYVLWVIATASQTIASIAKMPVQSVLVVLLKIPPMLIDIGVGLLLYRITLHGSHKANASQRTGLFAAAIYIFNPVVLYDSAIWGQSDAAGAFIMLLALLTLILELPEVAASIAVLALLIKPQFGVILLPLVGILLLKRHVLSRIPSFDSHTWRSWVIRDGPVRILTSAACSIVVFYAVVTPFGLNLRTFLERMIQTAQNFHFLTVNAFNPWAVVGFANNPSLLTAGIGNWSPDNIPMIGNLTGVMIGTVLLATGFFLAALRLLWRDNSTTVVLIGAYLSMSFFILPTRVHERYIFPAFAFLPLLATLDRKWLWATALLSLGSLMNYQAVLSHEGTAALMRLPFGEFLRSPAGILLSMLLQTSVFLFAIWRLRPSASLADDVLISRKRCIEGVTL